MLTQEQRKSIEAMLADESGRAKLRKDARGTLAAILGVQVPSHVEIRLMETEQGASLHVAPSEALSEDALDAVAGGATTETNTIQFHVWNEGFQINQFGGGTTSRI